GNLADCIGYIIGIEYLLAQIFGALTRWKGSPAMSLQLLQCGYFVLLMQRPIRVRPAADTCKAPSNPGSKRKRHACWLAGQWAYQTRRLRTRRAQFAARCR